MTVLKKDCDRVSSNIICLQVIKDLDVKKRLDVKYGWIL